MVVIVKETNGHNLGRYWNIGPQYHLYYPVSWLKMGENEILILDLHQTSPMSVKGVKTLDEYKQAVKKDSETTVKHLAVGKKISFQKQYSDSYPANGQNSLLDGICGTFDHHKLWQGWWGDDLVATIDLEKSIDVQTFSFRFLDNNEMWIMAPESVMIELSDDNINYKKALMIPNKNARTNLKKQIVLLSDKLNQTHIRITAKNTGKLPAWREQDGNALLFTDEIIVN